MTAIPIEERRNWIGGTDVAALFGKSPRKTAFEVWHRKAGNLEYVGDVGERGEAGRFMEEAISKWAQHKWDMELRKVHRHIVHKHIERFGVSLDYETRKGLIPVEIKNVDTLVFRDQWQHEGDVITRTPMDYLLQCQAQLACTGKPYHMLVACVGGNALYKMKLERHEPTIKKIESKVSEFWQSVDDNKAPQPDWGLDADSLSRLYRFGGGGSIDMSDNNHLRSLIMDYMSYGEAEKYASAKRMSAKSEILTLIGNADRIQCGPYQINSCLMKEQNISFTRAAHRRLSFTEKEEVHYD